MKKIIGNSILYATVSFLLYVLYYVYSTINFVEFVEYLPKLLNGLWITFIISGISYSIGFLISFLFSILSYSNSFFSKLIECYQTLIRYVPIIAILYLVYYGSGEFSTFL